MTRMELHRSEMRNLNPNPEPAQSPITIPEGPEEADTVGGVGARGRGAGAGAWAVSLETTRKIPIPRRLSRSPLILIRILSRVVRRIIPSLRGRENGGEGRRGGRERRGRRRRNGGEGRRRRRRRRGEGKREKRKKRKEERRTKRRKKREIRKRAKKGLSQIHGANMGSSEKLICGIYSSFPSVIFPILFFLYNVLILLRIQC